MRLLDYMRREKIGDDAMAEMIGGCSPSAVKKWKYGEREPDAATMARVEEVTKGNVSLRDWIKAPTDIARTEAAA